MSGHGRQSTQRKSIAKGGPPDGALGAIAREALKVLETKGLVEVQSGVGTLVKRTDLDRFLDVLNRNISSYLSINKAEFDHVMKLRQLLEGASLQRLAAAPDPERLGRLAEEITRQRLACEAEGYHAYQEAHFSFHEQIVDVLDNPVISMIYRQVLGLIRGPMERSGSNPQVSIRAFGDHGRMLAALERGLGRGGARLSPGPRPLLLKKIIMDFQWYPAQVFLTASSTVIYILSQNIFRSRNMVLHFATFLKYFGSLEKIGP